ncbi:MAG: response regulator [Blautia sp.]|nr:response regulator [Blautia sp.]
MRIVIVEDEIRIRNGLEQIITKMTEHQVVATAVDGEEGLEVIYEQLPDLVISDIRMPRMDGITMLEKLREAGIEVYTIFLTGYSEFEYARASLRLNAEDYLLKPVGVETLLDALKKTEEKLLQRQEEEISVQQLISAILSTNTERDKTIPLLKRALRLTEGDSISLAVLRFCGDGENPAERMRTEAEIILKENGTFSRSSVYLLPGEREILLLSTDRHSTAYMRNFCLHQLAQSLRFDGELMVSYGEIRQLSELPGCVAELEKRFLYGFGMEKPAFLDEESARPDSFAEIVYPSKLEQQVRRQIRMGNFEEVWDLGQQFEKEIMYSDGEPGVIKEYTFRMMTAAIQAAEMDVEEKTQNIFHDLISNLITADTRLQLVERSQIVWNKFLEKQTGVLPVVQKQTDNEAVRIVAEMIRRNYAEDISLSEAARAVGFTPEHLSRLFAREMGITFSSYLTQCRLNIAKRLLTEGNQKIYEIAKEVGYHDTKYFNRIFRAETGKTPMEYRRQSLWEN